MTYRALVIAGTIFAMGVAFNMATAEDMSAPRNDFAVSGVTFDEPASGLGAVARSISLDLRATAPVRSAHISNSAALPLNEAQRRFEVSAVTTADLGGVPVDIGVAQRTTLGVSRSGEISRDGGGVEARVGRRLRNLVGAWETPGWDDPAWYFFVADDDEAIAWQPGGGRNGRALSYQEDRVEIGDTQVGVAFEAAGVQASLAYVERDIQGKYGSADESFTGVTLTWRR